jgi:hypothetical protein
MARAFLTSLVGVLAILAGGTLARCEEPFRDDFRGGGLEGWRATEGRWIVRDGRVVADGGFSVLVRDGGRRRDVEVAADVAYSHDEAHAAVGIAFRLGED